MFLCGVWVFCSRRNHLLITLLRLEFIVLIIYIILYLYLFILSFDLFFIIIFLTFSVCEGVLGLSLLILIVRGCGNDYFGTYSILEC